MQLKKKKWEQETYKAWMALMDVSRKVSWALE